MTAAATALPSLCSPLSQTTKVQFRSVMPQEAPMTTRLLVAVSVAMVYLLYPAPMSGRPTLRNLTGTVHDRHHEPLKGAVVEIENENTKSVLSYITDRNGRYSFKRIDGE